MRRIHVKRGLSGQRDRQPWVLEVGCQGIACALLLLAPGCGGGADKASAGTCRPTYRVVSAERLDLEHLGARLSFRAAIVGCAADMDRLSGDGLEKAAAAVTAAAAETVNGVVGFTTDPDRAAARSLRQTATDRVNRSLGTRVVSDVLFFDVEYAEPLL